MKTRSKTEVIDETYRILTIRSHDRHGLARHPEGSQHAQMASADEAAIVYRISLRVRAVEEAGRV